MYIYVQLVILYGKLKNKNKVVYNLYIIIIIILIFLNKIEIINLKLYYYNNIR